jgi:hypothetical protein
MSGRGESRDVEPLGNIVPVFNARERHDGTRRSFRIYWLVVRPFSGLVRRRWLRAAARP